MRRMKRVGIAVALLAVPASGWAAEPGTPPVPAAVRALLGCWAGEGQVMDKPVTIRLAARPIAEDALLALDAHSQANADASDRYAAHLVLGGSGKAADEASAIVAFWSDSFGGAYTAMGEGRATEAGIVVTYRYPDNAFVNRWQVAADRLGWQIVAVDAKGTERPFANYSLRKVACPAGN